MSLIKTPHLQFQIAASQTQKYFREQFPQIRSNRHSKDINEVQIMKQQIRASSFNQQSPKYRAILKKELQEYQNADIHKQQHPKLTIHLYGDDKMQGQVNKTDNTDLLK